ncbi:hypothetical protein ACM5Q9_09740 [Advenella sp. RU8]|uniref:hypothetical protein n=1 Tax=Advenella sp. RU8 TaxID=3399575 RepID=UPI003AABEE2D
MDFFQQQLNKNREAFISIREVITGLQESSPKSSVANIAQALLQIEDLNHFQLTARLSKDMSNEIHDFAPCDKLLSEIAYFGDIREIDFGSPDQWDYEAFPDGKLDPDYIGWHRRGFIDLLLVNGWPVPDSMYRFNGTQKKIIPDWYKLYLSRSYLTLDEASFIIAKSNFQAGSDEEFNDAQLDYKTMLQASVTEEVIALSPNCSSLLLSEEYWQLNIRDIRRICHINGLEWPIPWDEEEEPLSIEVVELQERVKQLTKQISQYETQAKELANLKQENAILQEKLINGAKPTQGTEKPLTTRERNTLLVIIAGLCDYSDIDHKGREAAGQISRMTDEIKASITAETIRGHLNNIPDALVTRIK